MLKPLAVSESREAPRCQAMPDMSVIICRCSHCLNRGESVGCNCLVEFWYNGLLLIVAVAPIAWATTGLFRAIIKPPKF